MAYIGKSPTGTGVRSRYYYTATGGETSLSGADDNSNTLVFSDGNYVDVSLNGVSLVAGTDYNTSTANTIGGLAALSASDIVEIVVYDIFTVADTVSAKNGGTFSGNVAMNGDLTVDTNTLYVDSTNGRVSIGTSSAESLPLTVAGSQSAIALVDTDRVDNTYYSAVWGDQVANLHLVADYQGTSGSSFISMRVGGTASANEKLRILSSGGITFNGDTAAANALDDYEEGTFTPTLYHSSTNDSTFSAVNGEYTKIGNTVTCQIRIDGGTSGTAGSFLVIGGLPFAVSQAQGNMSIGIWGSNPSQQVGNIQGFNPPRLFKGGTDVTTQMTFFTAMLVYKTS